MLKTKELDTAKIRILVEILNMGIVNSSFIASHSFFPPWSKEAKKKKGGGGGNYEREYGKVKEHQTEKF